MYLEAKEIAKLIREFHWYVAYTKSRAEKEVERRLADKKISSFLPMVKRLKQWSDRKKWIEEPLFKSYIFVNANQLEYYKAITTTGIVKFITCNGKPVKMRQSEIEIIKKAISVDNEAEFVNEKFNIDDRVIVVKGALEGESGVLVEFRSRHRVAVYIDTLDISLLVNIPLHYLHKVVKEKSNILMDDM